MLDNISQQYQPPTDWFCQSRAESIMSVTSKSAHVFIFPVSLGLQTLLLGFTKVPMLLSSLSLYAAVHKIKFRWHNNFCLGRDDFVENFWT